MKVFTLIFLIKTVILASCNIEGKADKMDTKTVTIDTAVLGGGCFWCVEAIFQKVDGVISVESGYCGGQTLNPTYQEVCSGTTGHAEVCNIAFDKSRISYVEILQIFFATHDPTTLNRQGNDFGTQYRSVIFYNTEEQQQIAQNLINKLNTEGVFDKAIVTEVSPVQNYFKAEEYHQNYFNRNPNQPYCAIVIKPKLEKFIKKFNNKLQN